MLGKKTSIGEDVFLALSQGYSIAKKVAEEILQPLGIATAEYHVLRVIQNDTQTTATELQRRLVARAPTITSVVTKLEKKKLIRRVADKYDARLQHITLTQNGKKTVIEAQKHIERLIRSLPVDKNALSSTVTTVQTVTNALSSTLHTYD